MDFKFADIHSHLIPCIDDGSDSLQITLGILREMERLGTRILILTPHYCVRRGYTPSREKIESEFDELCARSKEAGIGIRLYSGCEIEFSSDIPHLLQEDKLVTLGGSKNILVEFPPYSSAREILSAVHDLIQLGFVPVLAHVERYPALRNGTGDIYFLKNIGALIQVNISYMSAHKFLTDKFLKALLGERLIDFVAGDVHNRIYTQAQLQKCIQITEKYSSEEYMHDIFYNNARKILSDNREE